MRIKRIRIQSNNLSFGPMPDSHDMVEQHLTLRNDGRIWLSFYEYGTGFPYSHVFPSTPIPTHISYEKTARIFEAIEGFVAEYPEPIFATDIGDWSMNIFWDDGNTSVFHGSLCGGVAYCGIDISNLIRDSIGIQNLFVFDGGDFEEDSPPPIVDIHFEKTKSKKYPVAVKIVESIPGFVSLGSTHSLVISNVKEYAIYQDKIKDLIDIIHLWKQSSIILLGKTYSSSSDYYEFRDSLIDVAGDYAVLFKRVRDNVAMGGTVSIEDLPLPFTFYGLFFSFAADINAPRYYCECERTAIDNSLRLAYNLPEEHIVGGDDPRDHYAYKDKLCFRCNKKIPKYIHCHPMYGGKFKQHYGWYIRQEYYRLGIDIFHLDRLAYLPGNYSPEIQDALSRLESLFKEQSSPGEKYEQIQEVRTALERIVENSVREQFGYKKIGDAWVSETILFNIVCSIYPEHEVKKHYRPSWLAGLELDIYIDDLNLGFEYQGEQHFKPIKHWGGEEQLAKQKEHDERKKRLCLEKGIRLICVNYDEPLTEEHIRLRLL